MGRVTVDVKVANNQYVQMAKLGLQGPEQVTWFELSGVVDTAANHLVLPEDVARRLNLPSEGEVIVHYADHHTAKRELVNQVHLELLGRSGTYKAIVEPERTTALIGAIVLEDLDFLVDCQQQRLYPRDPAGIVSEIGEATTGS